MTASSATARNRRNRNAGKAWERTIRDGGRDLGIDVEHIRDTGTHDQGDLVYRIGGRFYVIEAKNTGRFEAGHVDESIVQAHNFAVARRLDEALVHPVVFRKRHGKASLLDGFAITTVAEYLRTKGVVVS